MIYQLRLPAALGLDGFFKQVVRSLEMSLGRPLGAELQAAVAADLEKHILAFDTCGCSALCDEATVPAKFNPGFDPVLLSTDPADSDKVLRLHLNLQQDSLDVFTGALARFVGSHLNGGDPSRREAAAQALSAYIGSHLFFGEICRKTDLCQTAEPRPVQFKLGSAA